MSSPFDVNPYAPPAAEEGGGRKPEYRRRRHGGGLEEAIERLAQHTADANEMAIERVRIGPRLRKVSVGSAAVTVLACLGGGVCSAMSLHSRDARVVGLPVFGVISFVALIMAAITIPMDLMLVRRDKPADPAATLKSFLKAISMGRTGYAWAALCPTAREQTVTTPSIAPIETAQGDYTLTSEEELKAYLASFARSVRNTMRTMATQGIRLREIDGDVARVDADLVFQSWPQWVSIVIGLGAVVFRPLVLVGLILLFVMRKMHKVTVTKTLIKAPNGVWYVYDGDLLETGAEA